MELLELVKACQQFQNDNLPKGCEMSICLGADSASIDIHTKQDHPVGLEVKRLIGMEVAEKVNFNTDHVWHLLRGSIAESVSVVIYCQGLPPMCRLETYDEVIPKEQVIQTGEKTVVRRTRICCGLEAK